MGCLGVVLAVLGLSWAHLELSWGVLGSLGSQKAILDDGFTFSSRFGGHLGAGKDGNPPNAVLWGRWGR